MIDARKNTTTAGPVGRSKKIRDGLAFDFASVRIPNLGLQSTPRVNEMVEYLSLSALAKALGRDKSGLSRHAKKGTIPKRSDGTFDLEKVRLALAQNVDLAMARPARRRAARLQSTLGQQSTSTRQRSTPIDKREPVNGYDVERILVDGKFMTVGNATALAETYRARLAKMQFEAESGAAAKAEADAWTAWAPRAADTLAEEFGIDRRKLTAVLEDLVLRQIADREAQVETQGLAGKK
ncbi:hypothetical protein [Bradyrhizobium sp. AZCC 2289]|uniref:hypothetical protein n=1 Tax=Bradyrhizobium sp. AZCC 2289 TaxID=3117026 RepID=UPI002FF3873D